MDTIKLFPPQLPRFLRSNTGGAALRQHDSQPHPPIQKGGDDVGGVRNELNSNHPVGSKMGPRQAGFPKTSPVKPSEKNLGQSRIAFENGKSHGSLEWNWHMTKSMTDNSKPRIDWVDTAKAISIVMVVILHVGEIFAFFSIRSDTLEIVLEISTNLRMPLFFAAAGMFASKWLRVSWQDLFDKKLVLLIWVFLAWQPMMLFCRLLIDWILGSLDFDALLFELAHFFLAPLRPNGELWFLWTLTIFFILARLTHQVSPRIQLIVATVVSVLWMSVIEAVLPEAVFRVIGNGWSGLFRYYFLFIGCALFSTKIMPLVSRSKWYASIAAFLFWFAAAFAAWYFEIPETATLFLLTVIGAVGGFGLAKILSAIRIFHYLGKHTLPIYLGHSTLIAVFCSVAVVSGFIPWMQSNVWVSVFILGGLVIVGSLIPFQFRALKILYEQPAWFSIRLRNRTRGTALLSREGGEIGGERGPPQDVEDFR